MGAKDAADLLNVAETAHFSPDARVNEQIMATDTMVVRMNCYEPGQITPMHLHPGEDELIYIVEGEGTFAFRDADLEDLTFKAGDLVRLPGDQFHSIVAGPDGRVVLIYFMTPGYKSVRPDDPIRHPAIERLPGERS